MNKAIFSRTKCDIHQADLGSTRDVVRARIIMVSGIKHGDESIIDRGVMLNMSMKLKLLNRGLTRTYRDKRDLIEVYT